MQPKRKKGGQPGNNNAVKHGYYSRSLKKRERTDFDIAAGMEGIQEEIALLRFEIKKATSTGDLKSLIPLSKAVYALEKLIRTHHKLFVDEKQSKLETAISNVYKNTVIPLLGIESLRQGARERFPDEFPPETPVSGADEATNNAPNEAGIT